MTDPSETTTDIHSLASVAANSLEALSRRLIGDYDKQLVYLAGYAKGITRALEICTREMS